MGSLRLAQRGLGRGRCGRVRSRLCLHHRYKDHRNQEKRAVHASLPLLLQLDRQGEGEKTMVLPLRRLSSREQPYSGPDDPDEGAASAMERWVRELPRTGGVLGADARDASETAQEVAYSSTSPPTFASPNPT